MERIADVSERTAVRADVAWSELPDGRIAIQKTKFRGAAAKLLGAFKVPPTLTIKLDSVGSDVWRALDGKQNVGQVLAMLRAKHGDEPDLPERLGQYLSTMVSNGLIQLD
jgi:hypothetical protein